MSGQVTFLLPFTRSHSSSQHTHTHTNTRTHTQTHAHTRTHATFHSICKLKLQFICWWKRIHAQLYLNGSDITARSGQQIFIIRRFSFPHQAQIWLKFPKSAEVKANWPDPGSTQINLFPSETFFFFFPFPPLCSIFASMHRAWEGGGESTDRQRAWVRSERTRADASGMLSVDGAENTRVHARHRQGPPGQWEKKKKKKNREKVSQRVDGQGREKGRGRERERARQICDLSPQFVSLCLLSASPELFTNSCRRTRALGQ